VAELRAWGIVAVPRDAPPEEGLSPGALALHDYEAGRPSEHEACRIGDARFLRPTPATADKVSR
jgi:hydrogenase maturation protease